MEVLSGSVSRVLEASANPEATRRAETRYRVDGSKSAPAELKQRAEPIRVSLTENARITLSEARRQSYHHVLDNLETHIETVDRYVEGNAGGLVSMQTVAAAAKELAALISEITRQMAKLPRR